MQVVFMSFSKKVLLGSLLAFSASSAFAIDTADLRVIGTIAPTACIPTFAGGGVIDYGVIPTASLSPTVATPLQVRPVSYTISCDAPIAIGTSWTDSRTSSAVGGGNTAFGLGMQGAASIGRYTIAQPAGSGATGDGNPVDLIGRGTAGVWVAVVGGVQTNSGQVIQSYAAPGTLVPAAYSTYTGTFDVAPIIHPTSTLDMSNSITLDGLSTMTVRYL
jgi:hypothetical protein